VLTLKRLILEHGKALRPQSLTGASELQVLLAPGNSEMYAVRNVGGAERWRCGTLAVRNVAPLHQVERSTADVSYDARLSDVGF